MQRSLDVDLLRTFVAIAETGSFTRASQEVHKTQSAVSMQMRRLEDLLQAGLFVRDGRVSRLTAEGEHLLDYARRMISLNNETMQAFSQPELSGVVRFGTPDDYADLLLPEILARFARTHPLVQVNVECLGSDTLVERVAACTLDLALITCGDYAVPVEGVREETLVWVTSARHGAHTQETTPLALSHHGCAWRRMALDALDKAQRPYRIAYASANSLAVSAAVLQGLAVGAIPEMNVRPGMRVLTPDDGFPHLGRFTIGLVRRERDMPKAGHALGDHVSAALAHHNTHAVAAE